VRGQVHTSKTRGTHFPSSFHPVLSFVCFQGATGTPSHTASRFHGNGVRYKAKLIGMDPVPEPQGDKMCWSSMMKLKGCEAAARKQGKHKQRVWLKVVLSGLLIVDERSGVSPF
uniref:PID domain-containing protein n=1 Tax=Echeneis naucrates TaxID=173247 RepID=A0A665VB76_ECHNA